MIALFAACDEKGSTPTAPMDIQAQLDTCKSDMERFDVLHRETIRRSQNDSVRDHLLEQADLLAQKGNSPGLRNKVEDLRARALAEGAPQQGLQYCTQLARDREHLNDISRANALKFLAYSYNRLGQPSRSDSAIALAIEVARPTRDSAWLSDALAQRMVNLSQIGQGAQALALGKESLALFEPAQAPMRYANILLYSGNAYGSTGQLDSAVSYYERAYRAFEAIDDTVGMAQAATNWGAFEGARGNIKAQLDQQLIGLRLAEAVDQHQVVAGTLFNLALTYQTLKRNTEALAYSRRAAHLADSIGMADLHAYASGSIGMILAEMDTSQYLLTGYPLQQWVDTSLALIEDAMPIAEGSGNVAVIQLFRMGKANLLARQGRFEEARKEGRLALETYATYGAADGKAYAMETLANVDLEQARWKAAESGYREALVFMDQVGYVEHQAFLRDRLHKVLAEQGRFAEALGELRKARALQVTLNNDGVTRAVAEPEARHTYEQRQLMDSLKAEQRVASERDQRTIAELRAARNSTTAWGIGSAAILAIGGGAFAWRTQRKRRDAEAAEALSEERRRAAEYQNKALRAQMEPHFIRNTIGLAIARLRRKSETSVDDASELLASFSEWIDRVLVTSQHTAHALADELSALGNYLDLQRLRMNNTFNYTVQVDPAIDPRHAQVPPMLIQPLIENAIEHGLEPQEGQGHIRLSAERKEGGLLLSVEDDGVGRDHPKPERPRTRSASVSTANIREQLAQLSVRTGKPAGMRIIDLPKGTRVEVLLPL